MPDYVDRLSIRIQGYVEGHPMPESLVDGVAVREELGGEVDRARILAEARAVLKRDHHSFVVREQYDEMSWGAYGAQLNLLIEVGVGVVSSGIATAVIEAIRRVVRRNARVEYDSDQAMLRVREVLAAGVGCDVDDVRLERFAATSTGGWRATARYKRRLYEADVATDGAVTFRRRRG